MTMLEASAVLVPRGDPLGAVGHDADNISARLVTHHRKLIDVAQHRRTTSHHPHGLGRQRRDRAGRRSDVGWPVEKVDA
jgi:hypothetical protein